MFIVNLFYIDKHFGWISATSTVNAKVNASSRKFAESLGEGIRPATGYTIVPFISGRNFRCESSAARMSLN